MWRLVDGNPRSRADTGTYRYTSRQHADGYRHAIGYTHAYSFTHGHRYSGSSGYNRTDRYGNSHADYHPLANRYGNGRTDGHWGCNTTSKHPEFLP